jgi:sugar/nucleoside kinase (ribokinase family)
MSQKSEFSAAVAGHICLDIIPNLDAVPSGKFLEYFQPGLMVQIGPPHFSTGGPVSNTGLALYILGIPTRLMGKVGRDMYGTAVIDILESYAPSLASSMRADPQATTSYTIIISPPGVDRIFLHHPGANNTFGSEDIDTAAVEQSDLFHFGYPPVMQRMYENHGAELAAILQNAKRTGVTTSLDMCFPDPLSGGGKADWEAIYQRILPLTDIFSPSIEELLFTLDRKTYTELFDRAGSRFLDLITPNMLHEIGNRVLGMGVKILLLKLGERGAYLRTTHAQLLREIGRASPNDVAAWENIEAWMPCFQVEVVGTTGSGDATIAGFLSGFLRGQTPLDALTSAVAVGACNVEAADALSGLCGWEATQWRIAAGWRQHDMILHDSHWQRMDSHTAWIGPAHSIR